MKFRILVLVVATMLAQAFVAPSSAATKVKEGKEGTKPSPERTELSPPPRAEHSIRARRMPFDPKLIVYPYEPNYTYPILSKLDTYTHIQLQDGERIVGFYLSDTLRWKQKVSITKQDLFVKPMFDDLATTAALITTRRRYQISFRTVDAADEWHQRVSWDVGEDYEEVLRRTTAPVPDIPVDLADVPVPSPAQQGALPLSVPNPQSPTAQVPATPPTNVSKTADLVTSGAGADPLMVRPEDLNFDYKIEGESAFRPNQVFDDGRYTWVRFPQGVTDLPVPFALSSSGEAEIVQFLPRSGYHIIQQPLLHGAVLRLNKEEVRIYPASQKRAADCGGWFKPPCKQKATNIVGE